METIARTVPGAAEDAAVLQRPLARGEVVPPRPRIALRVADVPLASSTAGLMAVARDTARGGSVACVAAALLGTVAG